MDTRHEILDCGCCNVKVPATVDSNEQITLHHPDNGCAGARAVRIPDEVTQALLTAHRAQSTKAAA